MLKTKGKMVSIEKKGVDTKRLIQVERVYNNNGKEFQQIMQDIVEMYVSKLKKIDK